MSPFSWKKAIVFVFGFLLLIAILFIGINVLEDSMQPAQTQESIVKIDTIEPKSYILPTIAETPSPTYKLVELKPSSTSLPTFSPIPSLTNFIYSTQIPTIIYSVITVIVPINVTNYPTVESTNQNSLPPSPLPTRIQHPTSTREPVITVTCGTIPNIIPGGTYTRQIYWAQFNPGRAGLAISGLVFSYFGSGQRGCTDGSDENGYASCEGSAGMLPYVEKITVTIRTSVGECNTYLYISKD